MPRTAFFYSVFHKHFFGLLSEEIELSDGIGLHYIIKPELLHVNVFHCVHTLKLIIPT